MFMIASTNSMVNKSLGASALTSAELALKSLQIEEAGSFCTPAKRKRGYSEDYAEEFSPYKHVLTEDNMAFAEEGRNVMEVVSTVESNLTETGNLLASFIETTNRTFWEHHQTAKLLENRINDVVTLVGSIPSALSESFVAPTLRGSVAEVASTISNNQDALEAQFNKVKTDLGSPSMTLPSVIQGANSIWDVVVSFGKVHDTFWQVEDFYLTHKVLTSIATSVRNMMAGNRVATSSRQSRGFEGTRPTNPDTSDG